jgi:hypothetical protein
MSVLRATALTAVAAAVSCAALCGPADAARAAACPRGSVSPSGAQWSAAKSAFTGDFGRIRTYLLRPTLANQAAMYARVDAALFQYYSWQGGNLNSNRGKARGTFAFTFRDGSQCVKKATHTLSFRVLIHARFTSTNRRKMIFARVALVEMRVPKITRYQDPVTR